jgi:uncharacterized damage-inducible protein DinB
MDVADIRFLFAYDRWASRRVLARLPGIDGEVWGAEGIVGERGLGSILVHMLGAHQRWRNAFEETGEDPSPELEPLPSPEALIAVWETEWVAMDAFLADITEGFLAIEREGVTVDRMLLHLANHGTQHRSEAAWILTEHGRSPGDLDVIDFADELAAGRASDAPANA